MKANMSGTKLQMNRIKMEHSFLKFLIFSL